jgi:hypothetical protein
MYTKISYYFRRIQEASLLSIIKILIIKFKKIIFYFYYNKLIYKSFKLFSKKIKIRDEINIEKNFHLLKNKLSNQRVYNDVMNDSFQCLGYGKLKIPKNKEWHYDNLHDYKWKASYFNNIDYVSIDDFCDVKIPWEMSRLQYLTILAFAYIENKDDKVLKKYNSIINDWISSNPPGYGVNWTCTMEVAIRMTNMAISLMIVKKYLSEKQINLITQSLTEHKRYISLFPEISDIPGNHYLSNLMGAFVIESISGKNKSIDIKLQNFINEAKNQFLNDGSHFEVSPTYHVMCLEMVAIVTAFALRKKSRNNIQIIELIKIYENGVLFCEKIGNNYAVPIFGDNDSGQIISLNKKTRNYKSLKQFLDIINTKRAELNLEYHTVLLLSISKIISSDQKSNINDKTNISSFSGHFFTGIKVDQLSAIMRVGKQGLEGRASHDHDDALHVSLSKNGEDILVDKGCHSYTLDKGIRGKYIVSSAHNSLKEIGKERFHLTQGSIVKTVRGALTGSQPQCSNNNINSSEMNARLQKSNLSNFKEYERFVKILKLNSYYSFTIEDMWTLQKESGVELRFFLSTFYEPNKIDKKNDNEIIVHFEREKIKMFIKSNNYIDAKIFTFDYSSSYGSIEKSHGIHILSEKNSGTIETNFLISS